MRLNSINTNTWEENLSTEKEYMYLSCNIDQHRYSLHCFPHISSGTNWENLHTSNILSLVIISFTLMAALYIVQVGIY